jgi:hypothetical protein
MSGKSIDDTEVIISEDEAETPTTDDLPKEDKPKLTTKSKAKSAVKSATKKSQSKDKDGKK